MAFTQNWFQINGEALWRKHIVPRFAGKDNLRFLEIGSHEGGSAVWTCKNVLTGFNCTLECVDPFTGSMERQGVANVKSLREIFEENIRTCVREGLEIFVCARTSDKFFLDLARKADTYDLIYIDGSHTAKDVLSDAINSWRVLKTGGIVVFDDYTWDYYAEKENLPKAGFDAFWHVYRPEMNVLEIASQVIVEKIPSRLTNAINPKYR